MSDITIHHDPACGTSRDVLALLRDTGAEPAVVECPKTPPDRATPAAPIAALGLGDPATNGG